VKNSCALGLCCHPYLYARAGEHVDKLIYTESADVSLEQITDARLRLAEKRRRLGLRPSTALNVLAKVQQQVGPYFQICCFVSVKP
jgi:hypothetical protein